MRKITPLFLGCCLALTSVSTTAFAQTKAFSIDEQKSNLEYSFKSTLHPVRGIAHKFGGNLVIDETKGININSAKVTVLAARLDSSNKKRDKNMYEMFDTDQFPHITYQMNKAQDLESIGHDQYKGVLTGDLTIKNITRKINLDVTLQKSNNGYTLKGESEVSLSDFDLKPPSVLGIIRVFDTIKINFDTYLI